MNKTEFIKELSNKTGIDEKECIKINSIIEDTFIVGKKNKEKMIQIFMSELKYNEDEANKVYEVAMDILASEIK